MSRLVGNRFTGIRRDRNVRTLAAQSSLRVPRKRLNSNAKSGEIALNSTDNTFYGFDGNSWNTLAGSGSTTVTLADAVPSGSSLVDNGVGPNLTLKTLQAGSNVTITDNGGELEIAAGGGGDTPVAVTGIARDPLASSGAITFNDWKVVQSGKLVSFVGFISIFSGDTPAGSFNRFATGLPPPAAAYGGIVQFICQYNVDNNAGPPGGTFPGNYGDVSIQPGGDMYFSGNGVNTFTDTSGSNALYVQGSYFTD